jgi:hypothetical protein
MTLDYWCRKILPIGAIAALCLSTGNIPYLWLSVRPCRRTPPETQTLEAVLRTPKHPASS